MQATGEKADPNYLTCQEWLCCDSYDQMETRLNYIAKLNYVYILVL